MSVLRAVVTGASGGIGRSVVERLINLGYEVIALGKSHDSLRELADSYPPGKIYTASVDVSDSEAFRSALSDIDSIQAVVANAGICRRAKLSDPDSDSVWKEVIDVNLNGVWNTLRATEPHLADNGRIVVVSSGLGKLGRAGCSAYSASKHAVIGLAKCLSKEFASRRITVNAVCPGWVETTMARNDLQRNADDQGVSVEVARKTAIENIPLGRFVEADEVAGLICWLLSKDAAAITGQAYNISCGEFFA